MAETQGLVELVALLANAKTHESEAKAARIICEDAIVRATAFAKPEGQETFREEDRLGSCEVVLKQPITTNVDGDAWVKLRRTLMPKHPGRAVFTAKYSLDTKAAKALQTECPSAWADISAVITRKPGKIGVEVKKVVITPLRIDPAKRVGTLGEVDPTTGRAVPREHKGRIIRPDRIGDEPLPPVTPPDEARKQGGV